MIGRFAIASAIILGTTFILYAYFKPYVENTNLNYDYVSPTNTIWAISYNSKPHKNQEINTLNNTLSMQLLDSLKVYSDIDTFKLSICNKRNCVNAIAIKQPY
jgi:hypothetical protein